jgi:Helix-turn-helix domain
MANLLKTSTREEITRLLQLGWRHRRIARELKVDRGTVSRYARSAPPVSSAPGDRERWLSCDEEHDPHVEQLRPLARVLLLQARREMAARLCVGLPT